MHKRRQFEADGMGLDDLAGKEVKGFFRGKVRVVGTRTMLDLEDVEVDRDNSADRELARLTGRPARQRVSRNVDEEDDI